MLFALLLVTSTLHAQPSAARLTADAAPRLLDASGAGGTVALVPVPGAARGTPEGLRLLPDGEITLRRSFFRPLRFSVDGGELKKVYRWSGLSFHGDFEQVMAQHPEAFATASRARTYNIVAQVGGLMTMLGAVQYSWTSAERYHTEDNTLFVSRSEPKGLGLALVGAATSLVAGQLAKRQLERSVRMFNERQRVQAGAVARR